MTAGSTARIRPARERDRAPVETLLEAEDLEARFEPEQFLVADDGEAVVGCARLAAREGGCLELASVAVAPERRGEGICRALVREALDDAAAPVYGLCLAPGFFERLGFECVEEVPAPLEAKAEACCADRGFVPMVWRPSR